MEIKLFDDKIKNFIKNLEIPTSAKVFRTLGLLEQFGHQLGMPHSKALKQGLFELRIRGNLEIRLLYAFHSGTVIVLHGFIKKSQRTQKKEIKIAHQKLSTLDCL